MPPVTPMSRSASRSEEHTSELQSQSNLVCRLLLEKKKKTSCTGRSQELCRQRKDDWRIRVRRLSRRIPLFGCDDFDYRPIGDHLRKGSWPRYHKACTSDDHI